MEEELSVRCVGSTINWSKLKCCLYVSLYPGSNRQ